MSFQLKDFASIVAAMINHMRGTQNEVTDFNVGSVARTLVEAPAVELDELYQQMFVGLREAIPVSIYNAFEFPKIAPVLASGQVRVTITPDPVNNTLISAGTVFRIENGATGYEINDDVTIPAGNSFVDVVVHARTAGALGNIPAGQEFTLQPTLPNLVSAVNQAAFTNGADEESDAQRKERFADFIRSLSRGTVASIEYGLSTVEITDASGQVLERVVSAAVVEPYELDPGNPTGLVECYLHNGSAPASGALVGRAEEVIYGYTDPDTGEKIPGWKAAGTKVDIFSATEVLVNASGTVTAASGYVAADLATQAEAAIAEYIQGIPMGNAGSEAVRAEMIALVKRGIEGVYDFVLTTPAANVTATFGQKLMPGTISITAA